MNDIVHSTAQALDAAARAMLVALDERAVELLRLAIAEAGMGVGVVGSPDAVVELAVRMVLSGARRPARR